MDDYSFIKWCESLDADKLRRTESFQSVAHRKMVDAHEMHKLMLEWGKSKDARNATKLADLANWWAEREAKDKAEQEAEFQARLQKPRPKPSPANIEFTDEQLAIARKVFGG